MFLAHSRRSLNEDAIMSQTLCSVCFQYIPVTGAARVGAENAATNTPARIILLDKIYFL